MLIQKQQAIQTALDGKWESAINLNLALLEEEPADIETLNRLAFAYTAIGRLKEAKKTYTKVLKVDVFNPIAIRNLKRLNGAEKSENANLHLESDMFLEESGKTKMVTLINTAQPNILKTLYIGQMLKLQIKRLKIFVVNEKKQYIGMLPDTVGKRLINFIDGGNNYVTYVRSVEERGVSIFIKETKRVSRFKNQPSFLSSESSLLMSNSKSKTNHLAESDKDEA